MKLSRQLLVIHSLIIGLLVFGFTWLSLLNLQELSINELQNQSDNAAQYLAEPLTQYVVDGDKTVYQTKIDNYYDSGHYASITLTSISEEKSSVLYERKDLAGSAQVPDWFIYLIPVAPIAGEQKIYRELDAIAELSVQVHPHAFYQFVWQQFIDILSVTLFVGMIAWALGMALINIVLHPIVAIRRQAAAVAHKHFPQIQTRSGIAEFEQLIDAHNEMTHHIKVLFAQQQKRMDELKHELYHNNASGLPNRNYFNLTLRDLLESKQNKASGALVIIHLADMAHLRQKEGFATYLAVLEFVVQATERITGMGKNCPLFQLNDQDLALLLLH
jgi:methyl-accepting chemotaxis protein